MKLSALPFYNEYREQMIARPVIQLKRDEHDRIHIPMHDNIVRRQGRIAATVTHQALLLASGGRYARLQSGS
jgi:hypothetical protein